MTSEATDTKKTMNTAIWNTVANVISLIIGTVMVPLITRVFTQEELGIASTFISNRNTLSILISLAIYSYVNHGLVDYKERERDFICSIVLFIVLSTAVAFIVCLPFMQAIQSILSLDNFLFFWLFPSMTCLALYYVAYYYCVFVNKTKILFWIVLSVGPVSQVISVVLARLLSGYGHIGRVIGLDASYIVISICLLVWLVAQRNRLRPNGKYVSRSLAFTVPLIPHLISQMVLTQCDLTMITMLAGADKSGIYSMGHTIGNLAYTVMTQIMAAWSPWVYRRIKAGNKLAVKKNCKFIILIGAYLSCGLITITPEVVDLFLPESYAATAIITNPLITAMYFQFCYTFLYDIEYYFEKPHWIAVGSIITAIVNVVLNIILIPRFGYVIASYVTVFSYVILFLVNLFFAWKLNIKHIYNLPTLLGSLVFMVAFSTIAQFLTAWPLPRYLIMICITVIVALTQRQTLKTILGSLRN